MANANDDRLVSLPYTIARELLEDKMRSLNGEMEKILHKWNQTDVESFQEATKQGKIPEAETDAIIVGNIARKAFDYHKLYNNL